MTRSIKHIVIVFLLIAQPILVYGQSKVIVFTRKLEQKWEVKTGSKIIINGEKAKIIIEQSNTDFTEVQLKLISKHANIALAKKELKYLKYNLTKSGHEYYLNNQILLPANISQPEARLEAVYLVKAPSGCYISIENNLGDIHLKGLNNTILINIKYGNIFLNNISGDLDITTNIGDLKANGLSGETKIQSEYSEIRLENIIGDYNLQAKYGSLNILPGMDLNKLKIDANKTDVYFVNKSCKEYNLDIETQFGVIKLVQLCYAKEENNLNKVVQKGKVIEIKYEKSGTHPEIVINLKFADLYLQ